MKTIKILGTWCPNCIKLESNVRKALEQLKTLANIEKITDMSEIMTYNIMSLPWIVINWKLVSSWRVLEVEEIIELLDNSCSKWEDCCWWVNCDDDEEDECCSDNSCFVEEKKSKSGCCCGWGNC
jgi:small redox-active disulfide protein 2